MHRIRFIDEISVHIKFVVQNSDLSPTSFQVFHPVPDPLRPKVFSLYIPFLYLSICLKLKNSVKMALALHEFHTRGAPIQQMPINRKIGDVR